MKSFFLTLLFFLIGFVTRGQSELTTLLSKDGYDENSIQAFGVGDTLFVFYKGTTRKSHNTICVLPDGSQKQMELDDINGKLVMGVREVRDSIYIHYIEEEKQALMLKVLAFNKANNAKKIEDKKLALAGKLFGSYWVDNTLSIICGRENDFTASVIKINHLSIVDEKRFKILPNFFSQSSMAFIPEQGFIRPFQADATTKIYQQKDVLYFGIDETMPVKRSVIIKGDLISGSNTIKTFFESDSKKFRTFVLNDYVFKLVEDKGLELNVYDFSDTKLLNTLVLDEQYPYNSKIAYERIGLTKVVKEITVKKTIDAWGRPFVIPYFDTGSGAFILKIGDYEPTKMPTVPMLSSFGRIIEILSTAAFAASIAFDNEYSQDRYFYLKGDPENGFNYYNSSADLPDQIIDNYEISLNIKPNEFRYKAYLKTGNHTYGFYRPGKKYQELKIIKF